MNSTIIPKRKVKRLHGLLWIGVAVCLLFLTMLCLPHQTKRYSLNQTLQNGTPIRVDVTLMAQTPWTSADHLLSMKVWIDSQTIAVPEATYKQIQGFDPSKPPVVSEWRGYPQIIMYGSKGEPLQEVRWWFLNNAFAELSVEKNRQWEMSYYADMNHTVTTISPQGTSKDGIIVASSDLSIKSIDHKKTGK